MGSLGFLVVASSSGKHDSEEPFLLALQRGVAGEYPEALLSRSWWVEKEQRVRGVSTGSRWWDWGTERQWLGVMLGDIPPAFTAPS